MSSRNEEGQNIHIYMLKLVLKSEELDIVFAECGCPAGMGPKESCKHIAAIAYALVDFNHHEKFT